MTLFTENPLEKMMVQRPTGRRDNAPPVPKSPACMRCPYKAQSPCIGYCLKQAQEKKHTAPESRNVPTGRMNAVIAPPMRSLRGVFGKIFRKLRSKKEITLPIYTTGCGSHRGSPKIASKMNPPRTAKKISMWPPLCTARSRCNAKRAFPANRGHRAHSRRQSAHTIHNNFSAAQRTFP